MKKWLQMCRLSSKTTQFRWWLKRMWIQHILCTLHQPWWHTELRSSTPRCQAREPQPRDLISSSSSTWTPSQWTSVHSNSFSSSKPLILKCLSLQTAVIKPITKLRTYPICQCRVLVMSHLWLATRTRWTTWIPSKSTKQSISSLHKKSRNSCSSLNCSSRLSSSSSSSRSHHQW